MGLESLLQCSGSQFPHPADNSWVQVFQDIYLHSHTEERGSEKEGERGIEGGRQAEGGGAESLRERLRLGLLQGLQDIQA